MKKLLFVFNPLAGKGVIKNELFDIVDIFTKKDYDVTVYPTQFAGDGARKLREDAAEYDMVVASGGDGTLSEAVSALLTLDKRVPLGYIPAGSTNDVAASLGLPLKAVECAKAISEGVFFDYDIGLFNGDTNFVYVAAFGAFTEVSYETPQESKNRFGHAAYLVEAMRRINEIRGYDLTIEHDGETIEGNFALGLISNAQSIAGMKNFIQDGVCYDDGLFEVLLIKTPANAIELSSILAEAAVNKLTGPSFVTFKTSNLKIASKQPLAWALDGESGGVHEEVEIVNLKQAIRLKMGFNEITAEQEFVRMQAPADRLLELSAEEFFASLESPSPDGPSPDGASRPTERQFKIIVYLVGRSNKVIIKRHKQ